MRKKHWMAFTVIAVAVLVAVEPVVAEPARVDRRDVVREWNDDGTPVEDPETIGWSKLKRKARGLKARVRVGGLIPGGIYTFWWVVPHAQQPEIPFDVFVAQGASAIADANGRARVIMVADTGQAGIEGFPPLEGLEFHPLTDPLDTVVRVEIAYHGQAIDAGADLEIWLSDFWTGTACPTDPDTPQGELQPHCPVNFAATHLP